MKKRVVFLVAVMLFVSVVPFTGCKSKKNRISRDSQYVEDSEWFNSDVYTITTEFESNGFGWTGDSPIFYADESQVLVWEDYTYIEDGVQKEKVQIGRYEFGDDGELLCTGCVDMAEVGLYYRSEDFSDVVDCSQKFYFEGNVYCLVRHYSAEASEDYIQIVDLDNNCLGEIVDNETTEFLLDDNDKTIYKTWIEDDVLNMLVAGSDDNWRSVYYHLEIASDFNIISQNVIELPSGIDYLSDFKNVDEDYFIAESYDYALDANKLFKIDRDTYEVTPITEDLGDYFSYGWSCFDGLLISSDSYKLVSFDFETMSANEFFSYDICNVDRSKTEGLSVIYADENTVISWTFNRDSEFEFWRFTRADSNPNVGKEILRVVDFSERIESEVAMAIFEYNQGDNECFIMFDSRYQLDDYMDVDPTQMNNYYYQIGQEYKDAKRSARQTVSNQIRVDIMAGEGPDIIIGGYGYNEFNNEDILIDLREELDVDTSIYINPVFAGGDPIYQLPLRLNASGVVWFFKHADNLTTGQGMDFETYERYVDECCNGRDPISEQNSRLDYFIDMFNYSYSYFVNDGRINIDNDEFRSLAEFVSTRAEQMNMKPNSYYAETDAIYMSESTGNLGFYTVNNGVMAAAPSLNGTRGVMLECNMSVAIVSSCPNVEAATGFVTTMMDCYSDYIEREAIRTNIVDYCEDMNSYYSSIIDTEMGMGWLTPDMYFRDDLADDYVNILDSAEGIIQSDNDISIILYEEIQAYFAGDKTIDEVIDIISDRAQTVLDERG